MAKEIIALEEKVAFLEDSLSRISKAVEEMNVQLVGLMKEVHNMRRGNEPDDPADTEGAEHAGHY